MRFLEKKSYIRWERRSFANEHKSEKWSGSSCNTSTNGIYSYIYRILHKQQFKVTALKLENVFTFIVLFDDVTFVSSIDHSVKMCYLLIADMKMIKYTVYLVVCGKL